MRRPCAQPRVRRVGCGLLGPDMTAGQLGRLSIIEGLAGLASGAAVQAVRERRAGTMTASTSTGPRVSKADRLLALAKQHHERRDATRWPCLSRDGRMAACCLGAGRLGNNVKSEIQGLHTEALQCAGYYGSHALSLRDHLAAPRRCGMRRGDPLNACPVARSEPARGGGCRAAGRLRVDQHRLRPWVPAARVELKALRATTCPRWPRSASRRACGPGGRARRWV